MKLRILFALLALCAIARGQSGLQAPTVNGGWSYPNNSYGVGYKGFYVWGTFFFPTGNGAPSGNTFLYDLKMYSLYGDSTNGNVYAHNPKTNAWNLISSGSGGSVPYVTSYGKNAAKDSFVLLLSDNTRFAAKDSIAVGFEPAITAPNTAKKYWNGYKQFVALNSDSLTEGSVNLFSTPSRTRTAVSLSFTTAGSSGAASGSYDASSGIFSINVPNYGLAMGSGISSLNGLTTATQTFATGTSGTDFNISSATATHTFNFPNASASARGLLTLTDWTTFNNKLTHNEQMSFGMGGDVLVATTLSVGNAFNTTASLVGSGVTAGTYQFGNYQATVNAKGLVTNVVLAGGGGGTGSTNSNIGIGYRWAIPGTNNIKTIFAGTNITIDSTSNTNGLTINSTASGGLSASNFVNNETPSGTINGTNTTFTLANTPVSGTNELYWNGVKQRLGTDYTISTATITTVTFTPFTGDSLIDSYIK